MQLTPRVNFTNPAEYKCAIAHALYFAVQFHKQNYAQLYQITQQEVTQNLHHPFTLYPLYQWFSTGGPWTTFNGPPI